MINREDGAMMVFSYNPEGEGNGFSPKLWAKAIGALSVHNEADGFKIWVS